MVKIIQPPQRLNNATDAEVIVRRDAPVQANSKTVHVMISGRVQGVGFRSWTMHAARSLNLSGWVRNCSDGAVEALFSGAPEAVDKMLKRCWDGPLIARVTKVEISPRTDSVDAGFLQRPTV